MINELEISLPSDVAFSRWDDFLKLASEGFQKFDIDLQVGEQLPDNSFAVYASNVAQIAIRRIIAQNAEKLRDAFMDASASKTYKDIIDSAVK